MNLKQREPRLDFTLHLSRPDERAVSDEGVVSCEYAGRPAYLSSIYQIFDCASFRDALLLCLDSDSDVAGMEQRVVDESSTTESRSQIFLNVVFVFYALETRCYVNAIS